MSILTGPKIRQEIAEGRIKIDPFKDELVGPNSVDLRIAPELFIYSRVQLDSKRDNPMDRCSFPEHGVLLQPGRLYLSRTIEIIGSDHFVPIVEGRSSFGRLGLHVHVTAGFCDLGFCGSITLELHCIERLRIYPNVPICQVYFLRPEGEKQLYAGKYQGQVETTASRMWKEIGE
jgi:dCTP deaminase